MSGSDVTLSAAITETESLRGSLLSDEPTERVPLDRIDGRVLAESVTAEDDAPPHDRATMDGYALDTTDEGDRPVIEETVGPGDDPPDHEGGTARRVATGAALPVGADAVLPVEDATIADGRLQDPTAGPGQHVLERGSVVETGETVLAAGRRLAPRDAATCRDLGFDELAVRERLSTAILATGTEIHAGREPDRDSETLANLVRAWGGDPTLAGSVPDDTQRVAERVATLAADHDVVVTTGGTGASAADETTGALGDGAEVKVENVAMRPGSNVTVARLADGTVLVALPGPPGAAFASALTLLRPLFVGESSRATIDATTAVDLPVPDRAVTFVVPVELRASPASSASSGEKPRPTAVPFGHPESSVRLYGERYRPHRVSSCARLSAADGYVLAETDLDADERVAVVPYEAVES